MLYFAYGSNMDPTQMFKRCPSSGFCVVARLSDHRLCFPRKSRKRNCGVASVERHNSSEVWGVVYKITDTDLKNLDEDEGYQPSRQDNSYFRQEYEVSCSGDSALPLDAWIYIATPQPNPPRPSERYMGLIITGARRWGLPVEYIEKLATIQTG